MGVAEKVAPEVEAVATAVATLRERIGAESASADGIVAGLLGTVADQQTEIGGQREELAARQAVIDELRRELAELTGPGMAVGASVGAVDGWGAIGSWATVTGMAPAAIRTYASGGFMAMFRNAVNRYPGVPQVYGPRVVMAKLTDATIVAALREFEAYRVKCDGRLWLVPDPEHDRHILKEGAYTMSQYVTEMARWHRLAAENVPGMVDCLWSNPTGYQAPSRFATYVEPVLEHVAGVAVDGYSFEKESGKLTQASVTDSTYAASYVKARGKRWAMLEQGCEAGPGQVNNLRGMLAVVEQTQPEAFIYWHTTDGTFDCRLSAEAGTYFASRMAAIGA